ncbi:phenylacetate--CoA ligase family protein [Tissierella praeacuta]|uniref:phenylacetate--CoA ligase family protein n=1 Tax=Tissierella praeacuta TaxID=43131 RepID=UPI001C11816D|nr:phenylacetate--CoA ligase family protein [Tissierella praeacuta]MBU5255478.1 phenylacetate--CoA ligase family protein [Tissierella praeacuta]
MDMVKPFIENILYPIMEKKNGNKIRENIKELLNSQKLDTIELKMLQEEKLKRLLLECIKNVPAYKKYDYLLDEIESDVRSAFLKFPVLNKVEFRNNSETFLNNTTPKSKLIPNITGGSTSEPVKFFMDRYTVEYYEAARWRGLSWWGITPGSRSVMIWGNPLELNQAEQKKYRMKEKWLKNRIIIPAYSLKPENMAEYVNKIIKFKPEYLYGYASALHAFASLMLQEKLKFPLKLKAIISTSETLHDFQREVIEEAFNCPVVNEYGARDGGILAYQCPCGNMHITAENAILEVVDPKTFKPLAFGESGILLVTDLNNFSMPRLRYQIGDRAVLTDRNCQCKMGLPILEKIDGREDDMFVTVDGELIHGHIFNHISRSIEAIQKFQIIQYSPLQAELKIIKREGYDVKEIDKFIIGVQELLPKSKIDVKFVDDIPVTASGKYRYAIRKFQI